MGICYLDRVLFERDARVFGEGGRGKGRHRVVPDGLGYFGSGWRESVCGSEESDHLLLHRCLPRRVEGRVGEVGSPSIPDRGGLLPEHWLRYQLGDCFSPSSFDQEGEES